MLERADGQRQLLSPDERIADLAAAVHRFDRVRAVPVAVDATRPVRHVAGPARSSSPRSSSAPVLERRRDDAAAEGQVAREQIFDGLLSRPDGQAS
ncbi:hypothetical protein [Streptomyces prasinosporus]